VRIYAKAAWEKADLFSKNRRRTSMFRRILVLALLCFCGGGALMGQDFKLFDRDFQVHGFASQGIIYTNENNWLTMPTSVGSGSAQFTDFGANVSVPITDKLRAGVQIYDRNLGELGKWHPEVDWAYASYKIRPWFNIRGGKVKTVLGLFNDTQDLDFLHPYALLPQSVYPTDLRDADIAHTGVDAFGDIRLPDHVGKISYTAYTGHRWDTQYGGYPYLLADLVHFTSYGGLQYGGDLRWAPPLKGLVVGVSRLSEDITGTGESVGAHPIAWHEHSLSDWTNQFYGQYTVGKLELDSEWRRNLRDQKIDSGIGFPIAIETDVHGSYVAGSYRITRWFQAGSYYSRYSIIEPPDAFSPKASTGHIYDKVITGRFDLNRFTNIKVEGHFMDGFGLPGGYPSGFYTADNASVPPGATNGDLKPNTNAFILKVGFNF
jgi:hypothetical protein